MSSPEILRWQVRYRKQRANGGPDRQGQWVVIVTYRDRPCDIYFRDEAMADAYVAERGLEGNVPIFQVP